MDMRRTLSWNEREVEKEPALTAQSLSFCRRGALISLRAGAIFHATQRYSRANLKALVL